MLRAALIIPAAFVAFAVWVAAFSPIDCDTDAQCAATISCTLKPGCDGGPYSQPWRLGR